MKKRVFLIVLDSFGIGEMEDAASFGDLGTNTIGSVSTSSYFDIPNLKKLGLLNIEGVRVQSTYDREIQGKGHDHWSLGNSRIDFRESASNISEWIPTGGSGRIYQTYRKRRIMQ